MFKQSHFLRLWPALIISAIIIFALEPGLYRDVSAKSEETYKGLKLFSDIIELVEKNYVDEVDTQKMIEDAIQGMVSSLDPHSSLLPPEAFDELQIDTKGEFTGIGIHVTMRDNLVTVISPIEGTPAYKAGIKAGDKIIKVDGEPAEELNDAVKKMRGPKGSKVTITILRESANQPLEFKLVRDLIPVNSVKASIVKEGYGYVWVTNFRDSTTIDLIKALDVMEAENGSLKGLILDLRDNPGGVLDQAIQVSDVFLKDGLILSIKGRKSQHTKIFNAHSESTDRDYPVVVLINGGSASASEIVAGALQDQKRALVLGTTSFGKGSVQTVESLRNGYGLKFTIARYYTPSGKSIQATGVIPDIMVPHEILKKINEEEKDTLKEKDLKNHLKGKDEKDPEKKKIDALNERIKSKLSPIDTDTLLSDSQVSRALDILISYDIFKDLKKNG